MREQPLRTGHHCLFPVGMHCFFQEFRRVFRPRFRGFFREFFFASIVHEFQPQLAEFQPQFRQLRRQFRWYNSASTAATIRFLGEFQEFRQEFRRLHAPAPSARKFQEFQWHLLSAFFFREFPSGVR